MAVPPPGIENRKSQVLLPGVNCNVNARKHCSRKYKSFSRVLGSLTYQWYPLYRRRWTWRYQWKLTDRETEHKRLPYMHWKHVLVLPPSCLLCLAAAQSVVDPVSCPLTVMTVRSGKLHISGGCLGQGTIPQGKQNLRFQGESVQRSLIF